MTALWLSDQYGHWGQHPVFSVSDWQREVAGDLTRLGYWEWVAKQAEAASEEA
jgi:hypothetical protein